MDAINGCSAHAGSTTATGGGPAQADQAGSGSGDLGGLRAVLQQLVGMLASLTQALQGAGSTTQTSANGAGVGAAGGGPAGQGASSLGSAMQFTPFGRLGVSGIQQAGASTGASTPASSTAGASATTSTTGGGGAPSSGGTGMAAYEERVRNKAQGIIPQGSSLDPVALAAAGERGEAIKGTDVEHMRKRYRLVTKDIDNLTSQFNIFGGGIENAEVYAELKTMREEQTALRTKIEEIDPPKKIKRGKTSDFPSPGPAYM